jgi:hypothetical protein
MLSDEEIKYLLNDDLFVPDLNWQRDPDVRQWIDDKGFVVYAIGYKMVADRLIRLVLNDSYYAELIIFPIVYLYRQYLELRLKQLVLDGSSFLNKPVPIKITQHDISRLWDCYKGIFKEIEPQQSDGEIAAIEKHIKLFAHIDPLSDVFRYPVRVNQKPSLPPDWQINIRRFGDVMKIVAKYLDAASTRLSRYSDEMVDLTDFEFELDPQIEE